MISYGMLLSYWCDILIINSHSKQSLACIFFFFFFSDRPPPEFSPLPLHDALPICFPVPPAADNRPSWGREVRANLVTAPGDQAAAQPGPPGAVRAAAWPPDPVPRFACPSRPED